jgi:hypothetical protein
MSGFSTFFLLILFFLVLPLCLLPMIFYILTLSRALTKCSRESITIEPGMLWLLLIPFVNLVWHFFVVIGMAKSLGNEFKARNLTNLDPLPGQSIGIAMCVCAACGIIPVIGFIAGLGSIVLWIIYWIKIADFSRQLTQAPAPSMGQNGVFESSRE